MVGPEPPQLPASAAERSGGGAGRWDSGLRDPHPRALGGAPASEQARGGAGRGREEGLPLSARANLRTRLARLPFCCVCRVRECARVRGAPVGREAAEGGREAGAFPAGVAGAPGLGGQWGLADTRLPGRGPWRSPGPSPARWQTFVSDFSAANKCLPDSGGRGMLTDTLLSVLTLFFVFFFYKSYIGLYYVYSFTVCEKVRRVTWVY